MRKRFVVLQITFCANEKISISSIFCGLKELGIEVIKIQWKSADCLKVRVGIDQPQQTGQMPILREKAVSTVVSKVQSYFKNAVVLATYGKDNR